MKVAHHLFLIGAACVLAGCSRLEFTPSLDEVINALPPDEWGSDIIVLGIATNNYTVLNRVVALTNVKERIRLAWKLYNHFRHSPEWYVEHREGGLRKSNRHEFFGNCAYRLMWSTNATPETIIEGWKMEAETIRAGMAGTNAKDLRREGGCEIRRISKTTEGTWRRAVVVSFQQDSTGDWIRTRRKAEI